MGGPHMSEEIERERGKEICWSTSPQYHQIVKGDSPIPEIKGKGILNLLELLLDPLHNTRINRKTSQINLEMADPF